MSLLGCRPCLVAFGVALLLTPLVRWLCVRFGLFDSPGPLKIHQRPVPRLGGIAIALAIAAGCISSTPLALPTTASFLASLALIWIAGLIDDLRGLSPVLRLIAQCVAALLLRQANPHVLAFGNSTLGAFAICVIVIFFVNAFNFLDGSDGLVAGVTAAIALVFVIARPPTAVHPSNIIAWSLLGAAAGFLIFNFPPAKIFMGDSGSTALGFCVALLALESSRTVRTSSSVATTIIFPFLVAGLPLLDAALAILRRLRNSSSPFSGDRSHYYDLLLQRRWSVRKVALVSYAVTLALGAIGWIGQRLQPRNFAALAAISFAALLAIAFRLGSLRRKEGLKQSEVAQVSRTGASQLQLTALDRDSAAAADEPIETQIAT